MESRAIYYIRNWIFHVILLGVFLQKDDYQLLNLDPADWVGEIPNGFPLSFSPILFYFTLDAPYSPQFLKCSPGVESLHITWHQQLVDITRPLLGYRIFVKENGSDHVIMYSNISETGCAVKNLLRAAVYLVRVEARNQVGYSSPSEVFAKTLEVGEIHRQLVLLEKIIFLVFYLPVNLHFCSFLFFFFFFFFHILLFVSSVKFNH